jgi:hypothetical protein
MISTKWTNEHCERCCEEENPQLKTHEIFCAKHYKEWLNEMEEEQ